MITLLTGQNSYGIEQELKRTATQFDGEPEKYDGVDLELRQLPDLLMGQNLFAEKRLVIIRDLSANKSAWEALPELLTRSSDDINLVLVEPGVDKRLKTYKTLQKLADVKDFPPLTERDAAKAERWISQEAEQLGVELEAGTAKLLIQRSLTPAERPPNLIDQWRAINSLIKLSVYDVITKQLVEENTEPQPLESVFGLIDAALRGDTATVHRLLDAIELHEDPYRVFGLLSSQVFQLALLAASDLRTEETAKAIGASPYALKNLAPRAKNLTNEQIKRVVLIFAEADNAMKLSKAPPWTLIEQALMKVANSRI